MNAKIKNVFWLFGLLLIIWLPINTAKARNIGGEPCDLCITIIVCATFEPVSISLTQGNLSEQYHVASLVSTNGPTVSLDLHYNSYNADYSHALLDSGLGYGWTHSYNIFLFSQQAYYFRSDGDGKVTRYQPGPGGIYVSSNGYFETLKRTASGFTLRKKDGATY